MPSPLLSAAAEVGSPVEPATKFFDPSASLGIMQRYGMSGQSRAFAEDALKSANEIDQAANYDPINRRNDLERHTWAREAKDKSDLAYEEKKTFENTLGTYLVDFARLDENADDFDEKLAAMTADPRALDNEAVKAIYNLKVNQREQLSRQKLQTMEYEKRLGDEIIQLTGAKPEEVWQPDGNVNRDNMPTLFTAKAIAKSQSEQAEKVRAETLDEIGKDNAILLDQPYEDVSKSRSSRAKGTVDAATAQKIPLFKATDKEITDLLDANPDMPKEAFIAQVVDLGKVLSLPAGTDPNGTAGILASLTNRAELPPALKPLVKSLDDTWAAHRVMMRKSPSKMAADPDAPTPSTSDEIKRRLEDARRTAEQAPTTNQ
jgi:hypothetical protein